MSRTKKARAPFEGSPATAEGWGGWGGMEGAFHDEYTLVHTPAAGDDEIVDMHVRPRTRVRGGASTPLLGRLKLSPNILVEDLPGSANPVLAKGIVTIVEKRIVQDGAGDYALIRIKPNRGGSVALPEFFRTFGAAEFPIQVTLHLDLGALAGVASGFGIPGGAMLLPVKGDTTLRLQLNEWKVRVGKTMWKDAGDIDLAGIPEAPHAALADLSRRGGTLRVCVDGGLKVDDTVVLWNEEKFRDAEVRLVGRPQGDVTGIYHEDEDAYEFEITAPPGAPTSPHAPRAKAQACVEVWPDDDIQYRLRILAERTGENDRLLACNGSLSGDAELFLQACVELLASSKSDHLVQNGSKFTNATNAVAYFQGYTVHTAKAFRVSLDLHNKAYERYLENLVAFAMELFFFLGEDFFKKVFNKVMKTGAQAAEKELQAEVRTLAHDAAEEAEKALLLKKQAAEAARSQLVRKSNILTDTARARLEHSGELLSSALQQQAKIAEKQAARKLLAEELEALSAPIKSELASVERELTRLGESLADDKALARSVRQSLASAGDPAVNQNVKAWKTELKQLEARIAKTEASQLAQQAKAQGIRETEQSLPELVVKRKEIGRATEHITKLEESLASTFEKMETLDAEAKRALSNLNDPDFIESLMKSEAEVEALAPQLDMLRRVKAARGTPEEFKSVVDQAMRDMPDAERVRATLVQASQHRFKELKDSAAQLEAQIKMLEAAPLGPEHANLLARREGILRMSRERLRGMNDVLKSVEKVELTAQAIFDQYTSFVPDIIKAKFNERASKLRQGLVDLAHIDYKAIPGQFYNEAFREQMFGSIFAAFLAGLDSWIESTASLWNWLCSSVSEWMGRKQRSGVVETLLADLIKTMAEASFYALTGLLVILDALLQALMWMLEGILYFANSPAFALSRLNGKSRIQAEHGAGNMPASLPPEFFRFSSEAVARVADALQPKKVAHRAGGKAAMTTAIKQEFSGAYREYYEPQWERARAYMAAMAGAGGGLDPAWLESEPVQSTNRDATKLLQAIVGPLKDYEISLKRPPDRELSVIFADVFYGGNWTPADCDKMFELMSSAISLGMKLLGGGLLVAGAILGLAGVTAPVGLVLVGTGGGMMIAGSWSDRLWALGRLAMVGFFTMPQILGAQFDTMRMYSLAYQSVFKGVDISQATVPDDTTPQDIREGGWSYTHGPQPSRSRGDEKRGYYY